MASGACVYIFKVNNNKVLCNCNDVTCVLVYIFKVNNNDDYAKTADVAGVWVYIFKVNNNYEELVAAMGEMC